MLKLIVFLGGAALMALEMVGSRVLAPHFGSSIFVWGSLISIFLTALSVGNYAGGVLADKRPRIQGLGALMIVPGAWIWLLPFFSGAVNDWVVALSLGPRWSPLMASIIFFAFPSIFLGTLSPYAIRLEVQSVESVGNTAGRLYALSTAGSIVGTLAASFFLIPTIGVRNILHILGLVLLALAALALAAAYLAERNGGAPAAKKRSGERRKGARRTGAGLPTVLVVAVLVLAAATDWAASTPGIVYETDSLYHRIIVRDEGRIRHLHFDNSNQSAMNLQDPDEQVYEYTRYLHLARLFAPDAAQALFVGLGGGSAPRRFLRDYPEMYIDVAELDPQVVYVAREYFALPRSERLFVATQDGRLFVRQTDKQYDLVVLDAYFAESIPFHLTTREFLEEVRAKLAEDGVVAANLIGALGGARSRLLRSMVRTYQEVFPQVYVFPVGANRGANDPFVRNIILVATMSEERLARRDLERIAADMAQEGAIGINVAPYVANLIEGVLPTDDVPILTDDYAPVDSLQHF